MASASPMTSEAVVLAVGAMLNGQASLGTLTLSTTSACRPSVERGAAVTATICTANRRIAGSRLMSSSVSPE